MRELFFKWSIVRVPGCRIKRVSRRRSRAQELKHGSQGARSQCGLPWEERGRRGRGGAAHCSVAGGRGGRVGQGCGRGSDARVGPAQPRPEPSLPQTARRPHRTNRVLPLCHEAPPAPPVPHRSLKEAEERLRPPSHHPRLGRSLTWQAGPRERAPSPAPSSGSGPTAAELAPLSAETAPRRMRAGAGPAQSLPAPARVRFRVAAPLAGRPFAQVTRLGVRERPGGGALPAAPRAAGARAGAETRAAPLSPSGLGLRPQRPGRGCPQAGGGAGCCRARVRSGGLPVPGVRSRFRDPPARPPTSRSSGLRAPLGEGRGAGPALPDSPRSGRFGKSLSDGRLPPASPGVKQLPVPH